MSYGKKFLNGIRQSRFIFLTGLILCTSFFSLDNPMVVYAASGAPRILNHQGRLLDPSGNLLGGASGTNYCLRFSFYDDPTPGAPDNRLWPTATPEKMTVLVKNGVFNVGIGDVAAGGDNLDFDFNSTDEVYLNIEVANSSGGSCAAVTSFETLSPRQRIASAANALNSNTVAGFTPAQSATDNQIPVLTNGNLLLGGSNAGLGSLGTNIFTFQPGATGDIRFFSGANTLTAAGDLTIAGILSATGINLPAGSVSNATLENSSVNLAVGTSGADVGWDASAVTLGGTATLNIPTASASARGLLTSTDWNIFNNKEPALTASTTLKYYRGDKTWQTLNTTAVPEGSNLYWTNARFDTRAAAITSIPSLTTVGTITSGTWAGNTISDAYISDTITAANYVPLTQKGVANGVAALDSNGKISTSQISSFAISDTFVVSSELEMLALATANIGDVAIRTDVNETFILSTNDATNIANWIAILTPLDQVLSVNGQTGAINLSTSDIAEGLKLYYTDDRVDTRISLQKGQPNGLASLDSNGKIPTSQLGSLSISNTFVVTTAADLTVLAAVQGDFGVVTDVGKTYILANNDPSDLGNWIEILTSASVSSVNGQTGSVVLTTSDITEGSNQYFTDARARAALAIIGPLTYDNTTGVFSITQANTVTNGYLSASDWTTFNNKQAALTFGSLTTSTTGITVGGGTGAVIGSGATIDIATAGTSTTGLVTSTDWNIFNNKQDALTQGNFTETGSSILSITGGSNAIIGSGLTIQVAQADATNAGFLSATDWSTFNAKEDALGYTPLNPANNLSDLVDMATARTNLGLGSLATASTVDNSNWSGTALSIANGGTGQTTANGALNAFLPTQTGNSGKYLTTDGTDTSWATVAVSTRLDQILAATTTNTINNASHAQEWQWNSLTTQNALTLSSSALTTGKLVSIASTSTGILTNTGLLDVSYTGTPSNAGQTTVAINGSNSAVGNTSQVRIGVRGSASGGTLYAGGGTGYGGYFTANVTGNYNYGVYGAATGLNNNISAGGYFVGSGSNTTNAGVYATSTGAGGYGVYATTSNNVATNVGVYGQATTTLNFSSSTGGKFIASSAGSSSSYGVWGQAVTTSGGTAYGGYFTTTGASATNIAGYFTASGGTNNYAGIFANGNVGIGTVTPASALHIVATNGGLQLGGSAAVVSSGYLQAAVGAGSATDMYFSTNAKWNGSSWNRDSVSVPSWNFGFANDAFLLRHAATGANPITWATPMDVDASNNIRFNSGQLYIQNSSGNVGIGDTTPDYKVDIESLSVDTDIFALSDSDGVCLHNPEAGSEVVTCSSDERLKTNITESTSVLDYFNSFVVKEYDVIASGDHMTGVIAQEVLITHPELVSLGENGFYSVQLPNQWKMVKAIQELNIKISDIENFAAAQNKTFLNNLIAWLADAANGITKVHVDQELCIGATCINEAELQQFKTWQGSQAGGGQSPTPPSSDPVPEIVPPSDPEPDPEVVPTPEPEVVPDPNPVPVPDTPEPAPVDVVTTP